MGTKEKVNFPKREKFRRNKAIRFLFVLIPVFIIGGIIGIVFAFSNVKYNIEIGQNITGGQIICETSSEDIKSGSDVTYRIIPEEGYEIDKIFIDGEEVDVTAPSGEEQIYVFENVKADHIITATFVIRSFVLGSGDLSGGTITPETIVKKYGESQTFTVTPNTGYKIASIIVDAGTENEKTIAITAAEGAAQTYTFENIKKDSTISATFAIRTFGIAVEQAENGQITPNSVTKNYGTSQTFTITPDLGYKITSIIIDGVAQNINNDGEEITRTISNIKEGHTITATFGIRTFTVLFKNHDGENLKTETVEYGSSATAPANPTREATAQYTYDFNGWDKEFNNITGDLAVTAVYNEILNYYTVTFIDHDGSIIDTQSIAYGSDAILPKAPIWEGHTFTDWAGSYTNIQKDEILTAIYDINVYRVEFKDYDGTNLKIDHVKHGSNATPPIVSREGYNFTGWNGSYENITSDITLTAEYTIKTFNIIIEQPAAYATINPVGTIIVNYGESKEITITPNEDYYVSAIVINGISTSVVNSGEVYSYNLQNINKDYTITAIIEYQGPWSYDETTGGISYVGEDNPTIITIPYKSPTSENNNVSIVNFSSLPNTVKTLNLPNTLTTFAPGSSSNLSNLTNINIDNDTFGSFDGALYEKDGSGNLITLIAVPVAKTEISFPSTITIIGERAFENSVLLEVVIPSTIQEISNNAFERSSISKLEISSNSTTISAETFSNMTYLKEIVLTSDLESSYELPTSTDGVYTYEWILNDTTTTVLQSSGTYVNKITGYLSAPNESDGWGYILLSGKYYITSVPMGSGELVIPASLNTTTSGLININGLGKGVEGVAITNIKLYTSIIIENGISILNDSAFYSHKNLNNITLPNSLTHIENWAFYECLSLTEIIIPASVTNIGTGALNSCTNLSSINIPANVIMIGENTFGGSNLIDINVNINNTKYSSINGVLFNKEITSLIAFPIGKNISSYIVPNTVETIKSFSFSYCNLITITFETGSQLKNIGGLAFYDCSNLTSITIPDSVTNIGDMAFWGCTSFTSITIPDSVISIGISSFLGCTSLTSVYLGAGVSFNLYSDPFNGCSSLSNVTISESNLVFKNDDSYRALLSKDGKIIHKYLALGITSEYIMPPSITSIQVNAFRNCTDLSSVIISEGVTDIGDYAFAGCTSLQSITIPDTVISIGNSAFEDCSGLTSITILNSATSIGYRAFFNCSNLESISLPDNLTNIAEEAFSETAWFNAQGDGVVYAGKVAYIWKGEMPENTSIELINGTKRVADGAFWNCHNLKSITIPDTVISIGKKAFESCSGLTSIIIPASVTSIERSAFYNCRNLTTIIINSITPPILEDYAFNSTTSLSKIYVPSASVDAYKTAAGWSAYASKIFAIP